MSQIGKWMGTASYGLFLALYVYAAAAYGLTRAPQLAVFQWGLGAAEIIWLFGYFVRGKLPQIGRWPWMLVFAILGLGWFVTLVGFGNDYAMNSDSSPFWDKWSSTDWLLNVGTVSPEFALRGMVRTSLLLVGMLMAIDFWKEPLRARGLILTMVLSASALVVFFYLQRAVGAPFILMSEDGSAKLAFATYRYHGNGADYLNLLWPIAAAVAIHAVVRKTLAWPVWLIPLAATLLATFINVSKAGNVLAPVGIVVLLLILLPFLAHEFKHSRRRIRKSRIAVALVPIIIIAACIPFALPKKRWNAYAQAVAGDSSDNLDGRMGAYAEFVKMIPEAGPLGMGAGTFVINSLRFTKSDPKLQDVWYQQAHEDYLQTLIEWGYVGMFMWASLLIPPFFTLFTVARRNFPHRSREFEGYRISIFDHLKQFFETIPTAKDPCLAGGAFTAIVLVALHSTVDFPMQIASLQFYFLTLVALGWSYRVQSPTSSERI